MQVQPVPFSSILGMGVSLVIALGLPAALLIRGRKKLDARWASFVFGCVVYYAIAKLVEPFLNVTILSFVGSAVVSSVVVYAVYAGLLAAILEEGARYYALKSIVKPLDEKNAWMFGAGFGALESILLVALPNIGSILNSVLINNGILQQSLDSLKDPELTSTYKAIEPLWTTAPATFWAAGIERALIIAMHICLSLLLYHYLKRADRKNLLVPFAAHFLVVTASTILTRSAGALVSVAVTALLVAALIWWTRKVRLENPEPDNELLPAGTGPAPEEE